MRNKLSAAIAILALGVGVWGYMQHRQLAQAQLNACVGTNIGRVIQNIGQQADFKLWEGQIKSDEETRHTFYVALRKAGISKKVLAIALKHDRQQLRNEEADVATKVWTQLSDCNAPASRLAEIEVYSIASKRPTPDALSLTNALKTDPTGSVNLMPRVVVKK